MAWYRSIIKKTARRAASAAGRAARRTTRRALPNFLTPQAWDKPKKSKSKQNKPSASAKKSKPSKPSKPAKPAKESGAFKLLRFSGRSLGSLSRVLRGARLPSKMSAAVVLLPSPPKKPTPTSSKKAPARRRKKGERTLPPDPRFERSQAKYEAKKEAKFRRDNDYLFTVNPNW